uniref:Uncharacterized protein n=1 Tax=Heterorhabditis bacteriophora TaxID=37862 RepID=A0A1I7XFD0_HETBA
MRTVFSAALISLVVSMRRQTKYIRLPSGYTFPKPVHMNLLNLPPVLNLLKSNYIYLFFPKYKSTCPSFDYFFISHLNILCLLSVLLFTFIDTALANYNTASPIQSASQGLSYSEFKQIMQNKIIEKIITGEGVKQPELIVPAPNTTSATSLKTIDNKDTYINNQNIPIGQNAKHDKMRTIGNTFSALGGAQFYQSMFKGKNGFSPLSFLLSGVGDRPSPLFVPVPIVVPPPPPPPPGPKCYTNLSGLLYA